LEPVRAEQIVRAAGPTSRIQAYLVTEVCEGRAHLHHVDRVRDLRQQRAVRQVGDLHFRSLPRSSSFRIERERPFASCGPFLRHGMCLIASRRNARRRVTSNRAMQSLQWYLNRARAMPADELAARAWRQVRLAAERLGLIGRRDAAPAEWPPPGGIENVPPPAAAPDPDPYLTVADDVRRGLFTFFGRSFSLGFPPQWNTDPLTGIAAPLTYGKTLDHRDSGLVGDIKHLWELNRHLELVSLAQAYRLTGDRAHLDTIRTLLESWMRQCPYLRG